MTRLTRTLSALALTMLAGCQLNLPVETTTALPEVRRLRIEATIETTLMLERIATGYRERLPTVEIQSQTVSHDVLIRRIRQGDAEYGVTLHAPDDASLWSAPLAYDALIVLVHPDSSIIALTPHDLRRLYSGVTRTWNTGKPVNVLSWPPRSGLRAEFDRSVMGQRRLVTTAQILPTAAAIQAQVAQLPNAIAYLPYSQWQPDSGGRIVAINDILPTAQTLSSGQYPLRLTVYLVGRTSPSGDYSDLFSWIQSRKGQETLAPAYVPLLP